MKRILFTVLVVLLLQVKVKADLSIFIWEKTEIYVPYQSIIEDAVEEIKSGIKLKSGYVDPDFYVDTNGVNYTYVHLINTEVLKTYYLYVEAVSIRYRKTEKKKIAFHVIDVIPPEVYASNPVYLPVFASKPNYLSYISYKDDTAPIEDIKVLIDESGVSLDRVGVYDIVYYLTDLYGNQTIHKELVYVTDFVKPTITKIKSTHPLGEVFNIYDYFKIEDNYDEDLIVDYKIIGNLDEVGTIEIYIEAVDSSGNKMANKYLIDIVNLSEPELNLLVDTIEIEVFSENVDLLVFVEIGNHYGSLTKEDIIVEAYINYNVIGKYEVTYKLKDVSNLETKKVLTVYIKDTVGPEIEAANITLELDQSFDYFKDVIVTDNYSRHEHIKLSIYNTNLNTSVPGSYFVTYEAIDEFGNHSYKTISVLVKNLVIKNEPSILLYGGIAVALLLVIGFSIFYIKVKKKPLKI